MSVFFFFNDTATTEIYTLSLHDALPICRVLLVTRQMHAGGDWPREAIAETYYLESLLQRDDLLHGVSWLARTETDRKSTRLNSSHANISYAVFCLKNKKK